MTVNLSTVSLLELYKEEKECADVLVGFPKFATWREAYETEYRQEMLTTTVPEVATIELPSEYLLDDDDQPVAATSVVKKPIQVVRSSKKKGLSNMDKARKLYENHIAEDGTLPSRKGMMEIFMSTLKISTACSSTYHHNIKQKFL